MAWIADMAARATDLLGAAPAAALSFEDQRRTDWTYLPVPRHGAHLAAMDQEQRLVVHALLQTALSTEAYAQVCSIVALEDVLDVIEGRGRNRHHGNYWAAVYGSPQDDRWGWSFEGHHVSVNITVSGDAVAPTPLFLGANPHEFVVRPLGWEEDYARLLARAVPGSVIDGDPPDDILTARQVEVSDEPLHPLGISGADLAPDDRRYLDALVRLYGGRVRHAPRVPAIEEVHFAWIGATEHGHPHYYRLQGPGFLVEYDNTQNNAMTGGGPDPYANHSHTVWRTPGDDFGAALLRNHREEGHHA